MAQSVGGDKSCPDLFWSGSHDRARSPLVCHRVASAAGEPNSCSCVRRLSPVSHLSSLFGVSVLDVRAALTCPDSVQDAVSLRSLPLTRCCTGLGGLRRPPARDVQLQGPLVRCALALRAAPHPPHSRVPDVAMVPVRDPCDLNGRWTCPTAVLCRALARTGLAPSLSTNRARSPPALSHPLPSPPRAVA